MDPKQVQISFNSMAKLLTLALQRGAISSIAEAQEFLAGIENLQEFVRGVFAPPPAKPELKLVPPAPTV